MSDTRAQSSAAGYLTATGSFTAGLLVVLDIICVLVAFNFWHWVITDEVGVNFFLTWKLFLIASFAFLYFYLMDLYTFDSPLSQLGMLERSFIAILLTGITTAVAVYLIGPNFIGGFVGRGVMLTSLISTWLLALMVRYALNIWINKQRQQVTWLVLRDGDISAFEQHFRSYYPVEQLLILDKTPTDVFTSSENTELAGNWDQLEQIIGTRVLSGVILTSESLTSDLVDRLMGIRISGMRIFKLSDFYEQYLSRLPVLSLDPNWIALTQGFELIHNPIGLRFKRYMDIMVALIVGLLLLPVIVTTALVVLLTSGKPIFYSQLRTGENGHPFTVYKFRTMNPDAEVAGAQFATENDPRMTPVGKWLRKYRLDELPQLWNVLIGNMSFIGPRPERPEFIEDLQQRVPYYNLRHMIKPGITGWAQVMYGYGDSADDALEKLQYDLFYIKNYSIILDISIMLRSLKVILFGTGR